MHYLFDVDGVLLKSETWRDYLIMEYGLLPDDTRDFFNGPFQACIVGKADLHEVLQPFLSGWGISFSVQKFVNIWFETESDVIESTFNFIEEIAGSADSLSIATNQEAYRSTYLWENLGLRDFFQKAFVSSDIGVRKPLPTYFQRIQGELGVEPGQIVFVDDNKANVDAAKAMGWCAVHYRDESSLKDIPRA